MCIRDSEVTGALSGVQISEQEIKETTNTGYFPDMFGGRVDRWGDKYEDNDPYVYESKASEVSIDDFKRIVDRHQNETLQFDDGKVIVDAFTANAVVQVYNALSEEQKQTFNDVVKTSGGVSKVANLAFKHGESKANEYLPDHFDLDEERMEEQDEDLSLEDRVVCRRCGKKYDLEEYEHEDLD